VLSLIRCLFSIKSDTNIRFDPSWRGYQFYLGNKQKLVPLINYLNKYPLKAKKKMHLTEGGLLQIIKLCNWKKYLKS
jgi:hypothetical protein